jgi:hypothetical protein
MSELEAIYARHCATPTAISAHLPRLRALADGLALAVEFGVKRGASSSALLMGAERVVSYDVIATDEARQLKRVAGERWDYRIADSRTADVPPSDLLFIDSLHSYEQVKAELEHADGVRRYLVCHDVSTFGEVGAVGETGRQAWTYVAGKGSVPADCLGIRPAIDELMIRDDSWRIAARYTDSHGLLVLERRR